MRQVFTSQRIENVEGVARLLEDAGIDVRINNARGWRGAIRGNFSYRAQARRGPQPEVWVLRSEDYPRARQLLREAGLEQRGHAAGGGFAGPVMHGGNAAGPVVAHRPASRARRGALIAVALAVAAGYVGLRWAASHAPAVAPAAPTAATGGSDLIGDATAIHRQATPPALAAMLVADVLKAEAADTTACITIDGEPPALAFAGVTLRARFLPAARCADAGIRIAIDEYRTDGSGVGTVRIATGAQAQNAKLLEVQRTGLEWHVLDAVPSAPQR